jgi:hypothetical protein
MILAILEAEIRRIKMQGQTEKKVSKTLSQPMSWAW